MSVYNRQNQEFVPLAETSGILQNMTSSNIEYVVCADGETPEFNTGIRLSPSKKLKFSQTVGVSYVRVVGNTTGDIIVTPNDEASSGGGSTTRIINHVQDWQPDTLYPTGTLVIYNNVLYKCVVPNHKTIFDPADWVVIGAGNDSGKGISVWNSQTNYKVDDIILHGNTLYVCVNEHVSSTEFGDDTEYWVVITDNAGTVLPDWQAREKYEKDEIVNVGGFIYRCKSPHISRDTFATMNDVVGDEDYWELISWVDWHTETQYLKDQIVYCDGALWRCLANHVSDNTSISNDSDKWIKICGYTLPVASDSILGGVKVGSGLSISNDGTLSVEFAPNNDIVTWVGGTSYKAGQYVIYNNNLYECLEDNEDNTFDETKWQIIGGNGGSFDILDWVSGTEYAVGDLVMYNHVLYQCTTANNDTEFDREKWTSIGELESDLQEWKPNTSYRVGNFVIKDNKLYKCTEANRDNVFNADHWQEIGDMSNIKQWISGEEYAVGEYVIYDNRVYECTTANSDTVFDETKWNDIGSIQSYVQQWQPNTEYSLGDLVIKDNAIYKCTTANEDSTFDVTKWEKIIDNDKSLTAWAGGKKYKVGQYVVYENKIYECAIANNDTVFDVEKWTLINEPTGLVLDTWKTRTQYKKNQVVEYLGDMYMCLTGHNSDVFKDDYDNGMWLKVDHSIPDYKKGSFYGKDSVIKYLDNLYRCIISHTALGDSPLIVPVKSYDSYIGWWDSDYFTHTKSKMYDLGQEMNIGNITLNVWSIRNSDYIHTVKVYAMPDGNTSSTPDATLVDKTELHLSNTTQTFEFSPTSTRYVMIEVTSHLEGYTKTRIGITGLQFGDSTQYWEKISGGATIEQWQPTTVYNKDSIVYGTNGLYICQSDHTSGTDFLTDVLAGKWGWVGKEGINNVTQTEIFNASVSNATQNLTMSESIDNFDYLYLFISGTKQVYVVNVADLKMGMFSLEHYITTDYYLNASIQYVDNTTLKLEWYGKGSSGYNVGSIRILGIKLNTLTTSDIAEMAMPSSVYESVTIISADTDVTAPANGYYFAKAVSNGNVHSLLIINNTSGVSVGCTTSEYNWMFIPVAKGDSVIISAESRSVIAEAKFIYTIGDAKALGLI